MYTIRFRLKLAAYEKEELNKRFRIVWHMHNETVSYAGRCLNSLFRDRQYIDARKNYGSVSEKLKKLEQVKHPDKSIKNQKHELMSQKKAAAGIMNERTRACGISKTDFDRFVAVMQKKHHNRISSQQAQKEAERVFAGVQKVLYGNGKRLKMKRLAEQYTISQKCATNGIKVDLSSGIAAWGELSMRMDIDFRDPYVAKSISRALRYTEISRLPFQKGYHYYITLVFDGTAPKKLKPAADCANRTVGIDPGMSTMAIVSEKDARIIELAPAARSYESRIARQQRLVDIDLRRDNPDNYKTDGTIKKGRHKWILSNGCRRRKQTIRVLNRKKTAATKDSHNREINRLIETNGFCFAIEKMDYAALKKRSKKKPERQQTTSVIRNKDGSQKLIYKYKRKRRFGSSVNSRSPASFLALLRQKAEAYGGGIMEVNTRTFRASQYRHDTGEYKKVPLSDRWKTIEGYKVQRDLYSAFLIFCTNPDGDAPDNDKCRVLFHDFVTAQDAFVEATKGMPHPACFGY